jgi:hypothetical protein
VLRGLSPMRRGLLTALALIASLTVSLVWMVDQIASEPSAGLCSSLAQVGATLLIAYAVEVAGFVKALRRRDGEQEKWLGFVTGIGACGLAGIGVALTLGERTGDLTMVQEIGFSWAIGAIGMLGVVVTSIPYLMYDWTHSLQAEYPDE